MTAAVDELVRAWSQWERHPAGYDAAAAMVDACQAVAGEHGVTATQLRIALADARRCGHLAGPTTGDELARCVRAALGTLARQEAA